MDGTAATERAAIAVEEARLSRAAAAGDGSAFAELYERYEPRAFNLAHRITGSEAVAADVVQEAFLKAMRRQRRVTDGELSFGPYLLSVTRSVSHDRAPQQPPAPSPEATTVTSEDGGQEEIRAANARLPGRQREALALRELEGLSYAEVASIMEVSPKAVAQLVSRARINLRDELRGTALASVPPSAECERALSLIACREDEQLEPASAEAIWLDDHLADCDRCRLGVEAMRDATASYRAWVPLAAPAWLLKETMAKAAEQTGADWNEVIETTAAARTRASSLQGMPGPYLDEPVSEDRPRRRRRPPRRAVLAGALTGLLVLVGLAVALAGDDPSPSPVPAAKSTKPVGAQGRHSREGAGSGKAAGSQGEAAKPEKAQETPAEETSTELAPVSIEAPSLESAPSGHTSRPHRPAGKTAVGAPRQTSAPKTSPKPRPTTTTTTTTAPAATPATPAPVVQSSPPAEEASNEPPRRREPPGKPADRPPR